MTKRHRRKRRKNYKQWTAETLKDTILLFLPLFFLGMMDSVSLFGEAQSALRFPNAACAVIAHVTLLSMYFLLYRDAKKSYRKRRIPEMSPVVFRWLIAPLFLLGVLVGFLVG